MMLSLPADEFSYFTAGTSRGTENGKIRTLGGAAGEDHFPSRRSNRLGHLLASLFHRLTSRTAKGVRQASGIAVLVFEPWQHRLEHARVEPSCRVVVEVDQHGSGAA